MYHYNLEFVLVGMPDQINSLFSVISPLERFSHEIKSFPSLSVIPDGNDWPLNTYVILSDETEWSVRQLRGKFGGKARVILCTNRGDKLDAATLEQIFDFWPLPVTITFARYALGRLQKQIKAEKDAWLNKEYLNRVIDMLPDMVWFKDMPGCHLKVNQAFCEAVGKSREDVTNQYHGYIWGLTGEEAEYGEAVCRASELAVAKAGHTCHSEETIYHSKRGLRELSIYKTPVYDENHEIIGTVGVARDVTEEREAEKRINAMIRTDALTGLWNRRYFYERMGKHRPNESIVLCYIDLDHFKLVNDTYGHKVGDEALFTFANLLRKSFKDGFITRMGGDEFVVMLFNLTEREKIRERMDFILNLASEFYSKNEQLKNLSMSIGIAVSPDGSMPVEELLQQADDAMYWGKEHGRSQYAFYEEVAGEIKEHRKSGDKEEPEKKE